MPTVRWEPDPFRIRYNLSTLERFDLMKRLENLKKLLLFQFLRFRSQRCRNGDGYQARKRRFMGIFLVGRAIEDVRAQLFRKRITILYPVSRENSYLSTDPFWEENEELFSTSSVFLRTELLK